MQQQIDENYHTALEYMPEVNFSSLYDSIHDCLSSLLSFHFSGIRFCNHALHTVHCEQTEYCGICGHWRTDDNYV